MTASTQTVFYPSLNEFCRKYLVVGQQSLTASDAMQFPARLRQEQASLFENFLLFDALAIKVYGENVPLALLIKFFGQRGLEELIEQGALKFVLWTPMVGHLVQDIPGINALTFGNLNSPAHCDPEASIDLGLNWLSEAPNKRLRKVLHRKVAPLYELPPADLAGQAVDLTNSAFNSGKLRSLALPPDVTDIRNLPLHQRQLLTSCASDLLEYKFLISKRMTSLSEFKYFTFFSDSVNRIKACGRFAPGFAQLAKLENFPDLKGLFPTLPAGLKQVPKLRHTRNARKFRLWFASAVTADVSITSEYINAIANAKSLLDKPAAKLVKSIALAGLGIGGGMAVEGSLAGAAVGGMLARFAEPAVDFGLDLCDEFLLDGLRKGWSPRMFFDDLSKLERRASKHPAEG